MGKRKYYAFHDGHFESLRGQIKILFQNELSHHRLPGLTQEHVIKLLVHDDHRATLEAAQRLCEQAVDSVGSTWAVEGVVAFPNLLFRFKDPLKYLLPTYTKHRVLESQAPEVYADLKAWVEQRVAIGREWAQVDWLFSKLHRYMDTEAEVRHYLPGVLVLMDGVSDLAQMRQKLTKPTIPKTRRGFDGKFTALCRRVNSTIVRSTLIGGGYKGERDDVTVSLQTHMLQAFTVDDPLREADMTWDSF